MCEFYQLSTNISLYCSDLINNLSSIMLFHSNFATSNAIWCEHITPNGISSCYWKSGIKIRSWTYAGYWLCFLHLSYEIAKTPHSPILNAETWQMLAYIAGGISCVSAFVLVASRERECWSCERIGKESSCLAASSLTNSLAGHEGIWQLCHLPAHESHQLHRLDKCPVSWFNV